MSTDVSAYVVKGCVVKQSVIEPLAIALYGDDECAL